MSALAEGRLAEVAEVAAQHSAPLPVGEIREADLQVAPGHPTTGGGQVIAQVPEPGPQGPEDRVGEKAQGAEQPHRQPTRPVLWGEQLGIDANHSNQAGWMQVT